MEIAGLIRDMNDWLGQKTDWNTPMAAAAACYVGVSLSLLVAPAGEVLMEMAKLVEFLEEKSKKEG
jgi:hypothetical protein